MFATETKYNLTKLVVAFIYRLLHECSCFSEFIIRVWEGLPSILSLFCNEFNKFNNTGARVLDYIHHMTFRLL